MIRKLLIAFGLLFCDGRAGRMARSHVEQFHRLQRGHASRRRAISRPSSSGSTSCCEPIHHITASRRGADGCASSCCRAATRSSAHGGPAAASPAITSPTRAALMLVGTRQQSADDSLGARRGHRAGERSCSTNIPTISCSNISRPPIRSGTARALPNSGARPSSCPNDVVEVGAPAKHRFSTFQDLGWLPLEPAAARAQLCRASAATTSSCSMPRAGCSVRYLFEHPERQRQLQRISAR